MAETFTGIKAGHDLSDVLDDVKRVLTYVSGVEFTTLEEGKASITAAGSGDRMIRISVEWAEPADDNGKQLSIG